MRWIDTHCHFSMMELSPEEVLEKALENGVERMINIGTCPEDHPKVLEIAKKYSPRVFCTLGVHPHDAVQFDADCEKFMRDHFNDKEVVAVGEIGLDYYYEQAPRDKQVHAFEAQMALAEEYQLPVQIHTRDAEPETIEILKKFDGRVKGLIHCFTGTKILAEKALEYGYNIAYSGIVTFKNAAELRETLDIVPLDRLHVETDAPFLTPVPFRGKTNHPAMVIHTAEVVAKQKQVDLSQLALQTRQNALSLFAKLDWPSEPS